MIRGFLLDHIQKQSSSVISYIGFILKNIFEGKKGSPCGIYIKYIVF
jgi:hypothetical protein